MAEVVANTGVTKEAGYFYYLGKDGNVWRTKMASGGKPGGGAEKVLISFTENINYDSYYPILILLNKFGPLRPKISNKNLLIFQFLLRSFSI